MCKPDLYPHINMIKINSTKITKNTNSKILNTHMDKDILHCSAYHNAINMPLDNN